ncbi:molecular chaperone DnaJ [Oscillatoriales cyanobacterium USR001]|nr:molecular chaperone DnaJ [Oscillatoriales cyanobacterium USR001]
MLIPLDYYRILGLPIQATAEQLQQAHRDRTLQLPRREYSQVAIAARKQLFDEAYAVLSNSEQRLAYDASFLAKTYDAENDSGLGAKHPWEKIAAGQKRTTNATLLQDTEDNLNSDLWASDASPDPHTPSIEIEAQQFAGALLILQELGEYEQVLKLARPYLNNGSHKIRDGSFGDPQLVRPDIVLTSALAYLELGREQWQQGQHENATLSLEAGQDLLLRESLFPSVRGEMQADLYKLRPYRILELLALPAEKVADRHRGLQFLREMLQERGGIDGSGDDQSGLGVEDFLRFMQQLRKHLTTVEQQNLFEAEARRPSAVATYLAVYTLLAQGFASRQPGLIRRAKLMLMQLGRRQDVHLEKAVCSLLLGQTEEASRSLELSSESEPLNFIRENSQDSPDLLPGLCLYSEHWLKEEVFPHFRDLASESVSLKDYFADKNVQAYLEALPTEAEAANEWVAVQPRLGKPQVVRPLTREKEAIAPPAPPPAYRTGNVALTSPEISVTPAMRNNAKVSNPTVTPRLAPATPLVAANVQTNTVSEGGRRSLPPGTERKRPHQGRSRRISTTGEGGTPSVGKGGLNWQQLQSQFKSMEMSKKRAIAIGAAILIFLLLGFLTIQTLKWLANALENLSGPLKGEQALVSLKEPPIEIPAIPTPTLPPNARELNAETGKQIIELWLTAKQAALGKDYAIDELKEILVEPALARWIPMAETQQRNNIYQNYEHTVKVVSYRVSEANPDQGQVEAEVTEKAQVFERGQPTGSRNDNLRVRYELVRINGKWRIKDWEVMKN